MKIPNSVSSLAKGFVLALVILFVIGFIFPTVASIVTEKALPWQSEGSPVKIDGKIYGSYLLSEAFNSSIFFQPRPSAIDYNMSDSGGYSYSIDNPQLLNLTKEYLNKFMAENPGINASEIPYAMISYSASGLDPNIPLEGATIQVQRISLALHHLSVNSKNVLNESYLKDFLNGIVEKNAKQNFPFFGTYYVNTVTLNFEIISLLMQKGIISQSFLD